MSHRIRIGNQTAFSAAEPLAPFQFAVAHGFDAFEWFADRKKNDDGSWSGWDIAEMNDAERAEVKRTGEEKDIRYTVHAPWQANPLLPRSKGLLVQSLNFARDIGADLVNLHLYMEEGAQVFVTRLAPVLSHAADVGVRIAIENTPLTTPADFREFFACLRASEVASRGVGMCLDLGHANLCERTRNDFIRYVDELGMDVPIIHAHLHENFGDADTHLPLFTGPARENDGGIQALVERLKGRRYDGALILEVWPEPPELLVAAEKRLRRMLGRSGRKRRRDGERRDDSRARQARATTRKPTRPRRRTTENLTAPIPTRPARLPDYAEPEDALIRAVAAANQQHRSWRQRLAWVRETLMSPSFDADAQNLATLAVYLRFLGTGEVPCEEDGRHFRPNHHARAAQAIEGALTSISSMNTAWIVRKIYPWLPSFADDFHRREPLTRIRDIAHRNDIPQALKREIKHRLQNKLHRCAGPEDFQTSEEILERITAPGADYSTEFVRQFEIFHEELGEFFNAPALERRLEAIAPTLPPEDLAGLKRVVALKAKPNRSDAELLVLLEELVALRTALSGEAAEAESAEVQCRRSADIELEDYAFALLSEMANRLQDQARPGPWDSFFRTLAVALTNVRLSGIEPDECCVLLAELGAWSPGFDCANRLHGMRLKATLERAQRLAEHYTDQVLALFPGRVTALGRMLGVAEHAIAVFCEADIRGNVIFQLSKLVELLHSRVREALVLSPWETVVPGEAYGAVVEAPTLEALRSGKYQEQPVIAWAARAEGDEEIPSCVRGILLGHAIPHLSHLGVRARQAGIPFAATDQRQQWQQLQDHVGKQVRLLVATDGMTLVEAPPPDEVAADAGTTAIPELPQAVLAQDYRLVAVAAARTDSCGAKAAGAGRLLELAEQSDGLFRAPRALALPFGVMERSLAVTPGLESEYLALQRRAKKASSAALDDVLNSLRCVVRRIEVPAVILEQIHEFFGSDCPLAIRSSANSEDLAHLAGAGLYDSVVNVQARESVAAIREVWASLWTRRATLSRIQAGISHDGIHMAVLVQELVDPALSFVMHTVDPSAANGDTAYVELAVGLGETLASAAQPGTPYRLRCERPSGKAVLANCASFSFGLRPAAGGKPTKERLNYGTVSLSTEAAAAEVLGRRFAAIASFLEQRLGRPQDVEGVVTGDDIYLVQSRAQQGVGLC
jgi:phosphoglucan,water dikinase